MSESLVVIPSFEHKNCQSVLGLINDLKNYAGCKEYLESSFKWNENVMEWSRSDVAWHSKMLAHDIKVGWDTTADLNNLAYNLGLAILRGRYRLECERLLAALS